MNNISPDVVRRLSHTHEVMRVVVDAVHGDCLDLGAGMSKYKARILERAKSYKTMDMQALPGIDVVGDVLRPPFADASFDTVVSTQVLEHVKEPWTMVEQMARVLRPGGTAIVTTPFMYPFHADPHDYFRYTEEGMRHLFERVGMQVELCSRYGGWWIVQSEIIKQKYVSPYRRPHPWWKRRLISVIETVCHALNRLHPPGVAYANVLCIARKPHRS